MHRRTLNLGILGLAGAALAPSVAVAADIDLSAATAPRVLGDPDAPLTMIEYSSMTCPHCAAFHRNAYKPIVERRMHTPFTDAHRRWQQLRRGRYVEFNLVWDRGTVFGLKTDARVESVLMSLPLTARWEVGDAPAPDSEEARLMQVLREPVDWVPLT